jgi:hypothetical protein
VIHLSTHAIARYQERVKPAMELDAAEREIRQLIALSPDPVRKQPWSTTRPAEAWVILTDGVALPLIRVRDGWLATSTLVRASVSPEARKRRNDKRARKGRRRRAKQLTEHKLGNRRKRGVVSDDREAA